MIKISKKLLLFFQDLNSPLKKLSDESFASPLINKIDKNEKFSFFLDKCGTFREVGFLAIGFVLISLEYFVSSSKGVVVICFAHGFSVMR